MLPGWCRLTSPLAQLASASARSSSCSSVLTLCPQAPWLSTCSASPHGTVGSPPQSCVAPVSLRRPSQRWCPVTDGSPSTPWWAPVAQRPMRVTDRPQLLRKRRLLSTSLRRRDAPSQSESQANNYKLIKYNKALHYIDYLLFGSKLYAFWQSNRVKPEQTEFLSRATLHVRSTFSSQWVYCGYKTISKAFCAVIKAVWHQHELQNGVGRSFVREVTKIRS